MNLRWEVLSSENLHLLKGFSCETNTDGLKSKERRKVKKHDKELNDFLHREAFEEQNKKFNTTHLLISDDNVLVGFVSLCTDSLKLAKDSRHKYETIYYSVPAIKIARLGVNSNYQKQGYGQLLLKYSLFNAVKISNMSGAAFITLDCYSHRQSFYEKNGFELTDEQPPAHEYDTPISMCKHIITWLKELGA